MTIGSELRVHLGHETTRPRAHRPAVALELAAVAAAAESVCVGTGSASAHTASAVASMRGAVESVVANRDLCVTYLLTGVYFEEQ